MVFADKLQSLRKSKGLSQEELAEKCNVTRQSETKWETGLGYPETEKLLILCEILDVDLDYLMRDKTATAEDCSVQREISSYESYVGKWVRIFLKDREFNGLHCVALVSIQKSYLIIMNDKGKLGFNKPGGFYSVIIESISNDAVIVYDLNECKHTSRLSDVLYIREC